MHKLRAAVLTVTSFAALMTGVSSAAAVECTGVFNFTGATTTCTTAAAGTYTIGAWGAQGGSTDLDAVGGLGANIGGDFFLEAGITLTILVGGAGDGFLVGGGGGGSFVVGPGNTPMVIAGGGGGAVDFTDGVPGTLGNSGSPTGGAGISGGGGGGFSTNGGTADGGGGLSFLNGGTGGLGGINGGDGGFGGGGGSGQSVSFSEGGGGGGGYSGGAGGAAGIFPTPGIGGGSFLSELATNAFGGDGVNEGNGYVSFVFTPFVDEETPVAEPATLALFGAGLIGLGAARRRRARR